MENNYYLGAQIIQETLENREHPTFACGGFVRDYLLKRPYNDIDLATTATPEEMMDIFDYGGISWIPTGLKHGTLTAIVQLGDTKYFYEITTLRKDVDCDGRHTKVEYTTSFEEDAKRRDFTINALYMDLNTKEVFDYIYGLEDIKSKTLRFVGKGENRIQEDYLRAIRFFRFLSQIGGLSGNPICEMDAEYFLDDALIFCSTERVKEESLKLLLGQDVKKIFENHVNEICKLFPFLHPMNQCTQNCRHHKFDVYNHTLPGLEYLSSKKDPILSLAWLLHDSGKPFCKTTDENNIDHFYDHQIVGADQIAEKFCYNMKLPIKDTRRIKWIIKNHMRLHLSKSKKALRKFINECKEESPTMFQDMCEILICDYLGMKEEWWDEGMDLIKKAVDVYLEMQIPPIKSPLDGREIMILLDLTGGPIIGEVKKYLKDKVIAGELGQEDKVLAVTLASEFYYHSYK